MAGSESPGATSVAAGDAKREAMDHLNQRIGRNVSKLSSVTGLVEELQATKLDLEQKLQFASGASTDQLTEAVQLAEESLQRAHHLHQEADQLQQQCVTQRVAVGTLLGGVEDKLELVQQLQRVRCYQAYVRPVQRVSSAMCQILSSNSSSSSDDAVLLERYTELENSVQHVAGNTACAHLHAYLLDMLHYWHTRLLHTFSREFESVLTSIKYPFISGDPSPQQRNPPAELVSRLQALAKHLLRLHNLPDAICALPLKPKIPLIVERQDKEYDDEEFKTALDGDYESSSKLSSSAHLNSSSSLRGTEESSAFSLSTTATTSSSQSSHRQSSFSLNDSCHSNDSYSTAASSPRKGVDGSQHQQPAIVAEFAPLVTPLQLLLKPIEVRFKYHFCGSQKTNDPARPEWHLTQVLNWVTAHGHFLDTFIQPVLRDNQHGHLIATTELTRGLVRLVVLKLSQDLQAMLSDEDLLCHCMQETLNFERELRLVCGYPLSQPSVLTVLTQPQILSQWLHLEKKFAVAAMDELVSAVSAWAVEWPGDMSTCGDQLVTLLQGVTDRYKPLPQPGHRLQFLEVQLEVLDEFRVRAAQVSRPLLQSAVNSHYPAILNTLHHLADLLQDWGDMPFFLELQVYRSRCRELEDALEAGRSVAALPSVSALDSVDGAVFDECVSLYRHVEAEMVATIRQHVTSEVRARFMPYKKDKWFVEHKSPRCDDVSGSLCPLLDVLARQMTSLRQVLTDQLYTRLWHAIAADIDKFMFEELVTQNHFSEFGSAQFEYDMTKALFLMFSGLSSKPHTYFPFVHESVLLLQLPLAPAVLLRDTLRTCLHGSAQAPAIVRPEAALADHNINVIQPQLALNILNARNNISSIA